MDMETQIRQLVELWDGVGAAGGAELAAARGLASELCARADAPAGVLSAAWRLNEAIELHLGLPPGDLAELARARCAAVSARHAASLLLGELQDALRTARPPVVVFSEVAAGRRLFGRHDVVPPLGALIVPLAGEGEDGAAMAAAPAQYGVRWGAPGRLAPFLEPGLEEVDLEGCRFLLAPLAVQAARLAAAAAEGNETCGLLFAAAVLKCRREGVWERTVEIADRLGWTAALRRSLARWRLNGQPGGLGVLRSMRRALGG